LRKNYFKNHNIGPRFSSSAEFEGAVSQVKFFRPFDDDFVTPKVLETGRTDRSLIETERSPINLLVVSTLSPSLVYEVEKPLAEPLWRSGRKMRK
jgi:hypothetical protein